MSRATLCIATLLALLLGSCSSSSEKTCTGDGCVELPTMCPCPQESYCDLAVNACKAGCITDQDCRSGRVCDQAKNQCRDLSGGPCPCGKGAYCDLSNNTCVLGCTSDDNCLAGQSCNVDLRRCIDPAGSLRIEPAVVRLDSSADPQRASVRAISNLAGNVTAAAEWSLSDAGIGTVAKGEVMVRGGVKSGMYKIQALYKGALATADLIIAGKVDVVDPSAPPDAKGSFGGATGATPPTVVYPIANSLLPPNLLQMKLQWTRDLPQKIFRIRVQSGAYQADMYVGDSLCSSEKCTYAVPNATWREIALALAGQTATLTIAGVAAKDSAVGLSAGTDLTFSPEDITGGVYYFASTTKGIKRAPIGARSAVDFVVNGAETGCAGCHAVSRDGKQVAIEFGSGQTNVGSTVVSGNRASRRNFALNSMIAWNFSWFNPAGDKLLTNWNGTLKVRDPKNGSVLSSVDPGLIGGLNKAAMPEWSPDGKWIAFVRELAASAYDFDLTDSGDIVVMPYNGGAFGPAVTVVAAKPGTNVHFWPSWSPDSRWLVFNTMDCASGCQQYNAKDTRLRLVRAIDDMGQPVAGGAPIDLVNGTHLPHNTNNWPKFAPFYQAGRYGFVIYSAQYALGFANPGTAQMYMFGLDMDKAKAGKDPSYRPVYLPFQDRTTANHSALWTTDIRCDDSSDCPSEYQCVLSVCTPIL